MTSEQNQAQRDIDVYQLAKAYLLGFKEVTEEILVRQLTVTNGANSAKSLEGVYQQFLESAQSAHMKPSVIGGSIGGIGNLKTVLCEFSPPQILARYGLNHDLLLDEIITQVKPSGQIRRAVRGIWPQYCKTALSGAAFLSQFASAEEFCEWVSFFDEDDRARPSLPMLLDREIHGLGFALACDFLKELGFLEFCKPDVHLKKILSGLGLSESDEDYLIFKSIVRIAKHNGKKPYEIDKLFWLIGSGYFHFDGIQIGRHADDFVVLAKKRLGCQG